MSRLQSETIDNFLDSSQPIPAINTSEKSYGHTSGYESTPLNTSDYENTPQEVNMAMLDAVKEVNKISKTLYRRMEQFGPEHVNAATLDDYKNEMNMLRDLWEEFDEKIDDIITTWPDQMENVEREKMVVGT